MPWDQMFDINEVMTRLEPVVMHGRRPRTAADFADALPEFMALPRYQDADGQDRLLDDLTYAIAHLPRDPSRKGKVQDREWARLILGFDRPKESITSRKGYLGEKNGSAIKYHNRYVVQAVLHRLQLLALDAPPGNSPYDCGFEMLSIEVRLTVQPRTSHYTRHEVHLLARATRGGQRLLPLAYGAGTFSSKPIIQVASPLSICARYLGNTDVITGDSRCPTHLIWLSAAPPPGATLGCTLTFGHLDSDAWKELEIYLRLITSDRTKVRFAFRPSGAFDRTICSRLVPNSLDDMEQLQPLPYSKRPKHAKKPSVRRFITTARSANDSFRILVMRRNPPKKRIAKKRSTVRK